MFVESLLAWPTVELIRPLQLPPSLAALNALAPQKLALPVIAIPVAAKRNHAAPKAVAVKQPPLPPQKKAAPKAAAVAAKLNEESLLKSKFFTTYAC